MKRTVPESFLFDLELDPARCGLRMEPVGKCRSHPEFVPCLEIAHLRIVQAVGALCRWR